MGLADRFSDIVYLPEPKLPEQSPFLLEHKIIDKQSRMNRLKEKLFEKIVTVPCWFEYDSQTQHDLIVKFLLSKNIKTPEIFAKVLQHSILGFGAFDEYLLKKDVSAIFYEEDEPLIYTQAGRNVVETSVLPAAKVRLAVQNIINMSQCAALKGAFDFRISDFWIQLRMFPNSKIKLSISKVNDEFLTSEIEKSNLSLLLSDF